MGVAGANIVVVRKELLEDIRKNTSKLSKSSRIPSILDWNLYSNTKSLYNTPAIFNLYTIDLMLNFTSRKGVLTTIRKKQKQKRNVL